MVGLPGFEPESIEPKSTSLDQASRQPQACSVATRMRHVFNKVFNGCVDKTTPTVPDRKIFYAFSNMLAACRKRIIR